MILPKYDIHQAFYLAVYTSPIRHELRPETAFYGDMWNGPEGVWVYWGKNVGWKLEIVREQEEDKKS